MAELGNWIKLLGGQEKPIWLLYKAFNQPGFLAVYCSLWCIRETYGNWPMIDAITASAGKRNSIVIPSRLCYGCCSLKWKKSLPPIRLRTLSMSVAWAGQGKD